MRAQVLAAAVALWMAGPALAQAPVATAPLGGFTAPPLAAVPLPLPAEEETLTGADGQPMAMGPCGPEKVKADGTLETKPHGEVEAGIGTNGYRHVAAAVCQPLGQDAAIAVRVSDTQFNDARRHH